MAVPSSGTLSLAGIRAELATNTYNASATTQSSLKECSDGTVATINTGNASADRPDGSTPHAMSEFYAYDHDLVTFTNSRSASKTISTGSGQSIQLVGPSSDGVSGNFTDASTIAALVGNSSNAYTINFWIQPNWDNNLNTNIHFFAVNDNSSTARNQQVRIFYNESNNRLEFRIGQDSSNRSLNFWPLHSHLSQTGLAGSSASQYWSGASTTTRGNRNSNNFTMITISKGTGTTLAASNIDAYWNAQKLGSAFYSSGNNFGTVNMDPEANSGQRRVTIGSAAHHYEKSGNNEATLYDEFSIHNSKLTDAQVTAIYNNGTPKDITTITGLETNVYYRFEGADGTQGQVICSANPSSSPVLEFNGDSTTVTTPA